MTGSSVAGSSYRLLVYVDDMHNALLNLEVELRDLFEDGEQWDGKMTCGFTAGTGKSAAGHTIESWQLYEVTNEQPQEGGGGGGILGGLFQ